MLKDLLCGCYSVHSIYNNNSLILFSSYGLTLSFHISCYSMNDAMKVKPVNSFFLSLCVYIHIGTVVIGLQSTAVM